MLHFFPRYARDISDSPFAAELRRLGVPHRFLGGEIDLSYRTTLGLLLGVYPRLAWFALSRAVRSLLLSRPAPTAAVVASDVEALAFGLLRRLFRRPTLIVLETVIVTRLGNPLYRRYWRLLLSLVDVAVCHSAAEAARYAAAFPGARCRFVCIPYGTTVGRREAFIAAAAARAAAGAERAVLAAGRSGRDYGTLAEAVRGLPCRLRILCDLAVPLPPADPPGQVAVVRDCFGDCYLEALADALFVVVPLAVDDISAGQMVLLQARALGKAVVVTRTATTAEYAADGEDALLVGMRDVAGMRAALRRLLEDEALRARIAAAGAARFDREHSTEAHVRQLVAAIREAVAARAAEAAPGRPATAGR